MSEENHSAGEEEINGTQNNQQGIIGSQNLVRTPIFRMATQQVNIDPIKYLSNLPLYDGNSDDLYTFTELVDRVYPLLSKYDDVSQRIFFDIVKSRLVGKAREAVEINNCIDSWKDIKKLFFHSFGDRLSIDQPYDEVRFLTFKTNCFDFYNEIKAMLRRLNNKTKLSSGDGAVEDIKKNCATALRVFINKIPDPMKCILCCRDPDDLEEAMQILHEAGYAFTRVSSGSNKYPNSTNKNNTSIRNDRQNHGKYNNWRNNHKSVDNNYNNHYYRKANNEQRFEGNYNYRNYNDRNSNNNSFNRYNQNQNHTDNDRNNTVEPMDVDNSTANRRNYNFEETQTRNENFQLKASTNPTYSI